MATTCNHTRYQCLQYEALKKLHFKSIIKCFKEVKSTCIIQATRFTILISPIHCSVRITHTNYVFFFLGGGGVMVMFNHHFLIVTA